MANGISVQDSITALNGSVAADAINGGIAAVQITGTWVGTQQFQGTVDGSTWASIKAYAVADGALATSATANGLWLVPVAGFTQIRVYNSAFTSGTAVVTWCVSAGNQGLAGASLSVTADTEFPAAAVLADNTANPTTTLVGACLELWDGATWDRAPGNSTDGALVNLGTNNDVTVTSGTITVTQATGTNLHAVVDSGTITAVTAITNALPAGANAIGKLAANSGVDIGDVDVTSVSGNVTVVQATGTNLHAVVDSGVITTVTTVGAVTAITNALPTGANVIGAVTQSGTWNVTNVSGTVSLPTGAATAAKQPALGTAGSASADVLTVQGVASMTPLLSTLSGTNNITTVTTVTTVAAVTAISNALPAGTNLMGKVGLDQTTPGTTNAVALAQLGATTVSTGNGVAGAGCLRVSVASDNTAFTVNAAQSGTWNVGTVTTVTTVAAVTAISNALPAGTNLLGKVGLDQTTPGTTNAVSLAQIGANTVSTGNGTAGTGCQRVTIASDNTGFAVTATTAGDVASAATDSGNPVKIGGLAKTANPTAVTTGQRVNALFDKLGKQVVVEAIRDLKAVQQTTITSSTAETTIVTSVASTFLDLYGLIIANTSATGTTCTIKDATSGTTRAVIYVPPTDTRGFMLPVSAGIPQASAGNNWTLTSSASVASLQITALTVQNL